MPYNLKEKVALAEKKFEDFTEEERKKQGDPHSYILKVLPPYFFPPRESRDFVWSDVVKQVKDMVKFDPTKRVN